MDNRSTSMDNIGPVNSHQLLSRQVVDSRYFFADLNSEKRPALTLAFGGRERCSADYRISRRRFGYHGLEYVAAGRGWIILDGHRSELAAGSVFAYSANTPCEMGTVADDPMLKYFFCFTGKTPDVRLRRAGVEIGAVRTITHHTELRPIAEDLIREGQRATRNTREICATLFNLMLLKLADVSPEPGIFGEPARQNFLRCKELIDTEVMKLRTLDEIARRVGLEKSSVCRLFRRFLGMSPYQYLLRQKMNLAAESLLRHGGLVKEVAEQMGFSDPFHFSRGFKAVHGKSPSRLRGGNDHPRQRQKDIR